MHIRMMTALLIGAMTLFGCRQEAQITADDLEISMEASSLEIGETVLTVSISDAAGQPVTLETLNLRGDMDMAGMTPVIRDVQGREASAYDVDFEWTMAGDWFVDVTATLPDGTQTVERFDYRVEGETSEMDDMNMDDDEGDMNMGGTISAYMRLSNGGAEDVTLIAATSELAAIAEIHETTVENDIARMQEVEGGLVIPAGETVEMRPGGLHVMLMNLQGDFVEGESATITLAFDNGDSIDVEAAISNTAPDDAEAFQIGDISIEAVWVRPTVVSDAMDDMEMEATEETGD